MTDAQQALVRVLEPAYLAGLDERSLDEVRTMQTECVELENMLSYVRRILQGRLDILTAETERRANGSSMEELVASLPSILGGEPARTDPAHARVVPHLAPGEEYELPPELARAVDDASLARLPQLTDDELRTTTEELEKLERALSADRRSLHAVIDRIERDLAARLVVEA